MTYPSGKKTALAILVVAIVAMLPSLEKLRILAVASAGRCTVHRFDRAAWSDSARTYSSEAVRGCMVDDLLARTDFRGQTRAQLVKLLGEPRRTGYFPEYDLVYWLGPEGGLAGIDSEWLVIKLNAAGRVTETRVVTD
jgi:outer membrane protein assembly factor BamE (lipoprotein component of BamABCDE complex)